MNPESEYTRKRLTKFLCQELLYEYVTHNLDSHREKEIMDFVESDRDSQRELDNLNKGLRYTLQAAKVEVSPKLYHALENFEPQWQKQLRAWTLWSSQRGWKMMPYVFVVLAVVAGLIATKPWIPRADEDVLLAEQLKKEPDIAELEKPALQSKSAPVPPVVAEAPPPPPAEEGAETVAPPPPTPAQTKPVMESAYLPDVMETLFRDWLPAVKGFKPSNLLVNPVAQAGNQQRNEKAAAAEEVESAEIKAQEDPEAMGRGFLFRATIEVQDFQNSWPAIRDKIVALGGKVAGNVELGWLRRPTEAYFHFSLPESNMKELEIYLGTFSPVQFSKDRHPRVMPDGQIRIIMSVKDGITQHEGPAATP